MAFKTSISQESDNTAYTTIHALLSLSSLQNKEGEKPVSLGKFGKKDSKKRLDYENLFYKLERSGKVKITQKRYTFVSITDEGEKQLIQALKDPSFKFGGDIISSREANKALELLQQQLSQVGDSVAADNGALGERISSYVTFKAIVLKVFDELNKEYNYDGLVPIWHLRQKLGQSVRRAEFNDWLMELQGEQLLYLQRGQARGITDEQMQDSIIDDVRGLLFFVSYPS